MYYAITYYVVDGDTDTIILQADSPAVALEMLRVQLADDDILEDDYGTYSVFASTHPIYDWDVPKDKRYPESQHFL